MDLKTEVSLCLKRLANDVKAFPWEDKQAYGHWLGQTYYYVCHSTKLLALAASRFDDVKIHGRFLEHLREERGHEKLALHDLKHLGMSIAEIECSAQTHAFYMTQYYYLEHTTPFSFFGWILCLEGTAANEGASLFSRAGTAHGEKAASFLKVHAAEDVDHLDRAFATLELAAAADQPKVLENMRVSAGLYQGMLRFCAAKAQTAKKKAA